ncbi:MAG TPA: VWA domain-containing protein [Terriglobales bacterium]|nr:VWA domain-containing protein [Terriglobales bacterium]
MRSVIKYGVPLCLAVCLCLSAQTPSTPAATSAQEGTPTFQAGTEFVQVPVVVRKDGKHLPGLTKEMFSLKQDGRDQAIATFEEVVAKPRPGDTQTFDNRRGADNEHVTIIAVDTINTPTLDQTFFKEELMEYLSNANSVNTTYGMVQMTRNGIHVLHDFTADPKVLLATVKQLGVSGQPDANRQASPIVTKSANEIAQQMGQAGDEAERVGKVFDNVALVQETEASMVRFEDRAARIDTVLALQQLAQALKGIPGRKSLLWVGSGMQFLGGLQEVSGITNTAYQPGKVGEAMDMQIYTWKLLNDANVALYPIDARRTVNASYVDPSNKYSQLDSEKEMKYQSDREIVGTFRAFAAQTGGKPCVYRTDLKNCVKEAVEDGQAYYLLGFYVDKKNSSAGWHKLSVKLDQKASVNYRNGFIITKDAPEARRMTDLQLAMNSPFPFTALPFSGKFLGVTTNADKRTVQYELHIPPSAITLEQDKVNFDVVAVFRTVGGKEAGRLAQRIDRQLNAASVADIKSNGINYRNKMELPPGDYGVWFVLRDNPTGRTGSVTVPIKLP